MKLLKLILWNLTIGIVKGFLAALARRLAGSSGR
jgi:hypothetical protein